MRIQIDLNDEERARLTPEEVKDQEAPIDCKGFLLLAFDGSGTEIRGLGGMSIANMATALAYCDDRDVEDVVCKAAAEIMAVKSCRQ